jgi:hypothetical protein
MKTWQEDWAFLRESVPNLQEYLLSPVVYWPLGVSARHGDGGLPRLSLGLLLLTLKRLHGSQPLEAEHPEALQLLAKIEEIRFQWKTNWSKKATEEFGARLRLWNAFLSEAREEPKRAQVEYANKVSWRTMLELLKQDMLAPTQPDLAVKQSDTLLRSIGKPGPFVWKPELSKEFVAEAYWFLYFQIGK